MVTTRIVLIGGDADGQIVEYYRYFDDGHILEVHTHPRQALPPVTFKPDDSVLNAPAPRVALRYRVVTLNAENGSSFMVAVPEETIEAADSFIALLMLTEDYGKRRG